MEGGRIRETLGLTRCADASDMTLRVLAQSLRFDWTTYREQILAGQLHSLGAHVQALLPAAHQLASHADASDVAEALEEHVLEAIRACGEVAPCSSAAAPTAELCDSVAALAAAISARCAHAAWANQSLRARLSWAQRAALWRACPATLVDALDSICARFQARPCLVSLREQEPTAAALACALAADSDLAGAAIAALRRSHWRASVSGGAEERPLCTPSAVLACMSLVHEAIDVGPTPAAPGAARAARGSAHDGRCWPRARQSYAAASSDDGWLQPFLMRLWLAPTEAALVELEAERLRALATACLSRAPTRTHTLWLALAARPCWVRAALRTLAVHGCAHAADERARVRAAALSLVCWHAHPRACDARRRDALAAALRSLDARARAVPAGPAPPGAAWRASRLAALIADGTWHGEVAEMGDASTRVCCAQLLFAHAAWGRAAPTAGDGSAARAAGCCIGPLLRAAVDAQRASTCAREECVAAEGELLRALFEIAEETCLDAPAGARAVALGRVGAEADAQLRQELLTEARLAADRVRELVAGEAGAEPAGAAGARGEHDAAGAAPRCPVADARSSYRLIDSRLSGGELHGGST